MLQNWGVHLPSLPQYLLYSLYLLIPFVTFPWSPPLYPHHLSPSLFLFIGDPTIVTSYGVRVGLPTLRFDPQSSGFDVWCTVSGFSALIYGL